MYSRYDALLTLLLTCAGMALLAVAVNSTTLIMIASLIAVVLIFTGLFVIPPRQ